MTISVSDEMSVPRDDMVSLDMVSRNITRITTPAMGNTAHITIIGDDAELGDFARRRLLHLEQLWSRFLSTSDISRLNVAQGEPLRVAPETIRLIRYMSAGWTLTHGLFDPSMLGDLVRAGYDRSLISSNLTVLPDRVEWSKDVSSVVVNEDLVSVPIGLTLDPGGIGKGLAADIVADELIERGASGVFVSVGGDIRCIGTGDHNGTWLIDIESPFDRHTMCSVALSEGAVATSSLTAKMFKNPEALSESPPRSHIMDPRSRTTIDTSSRQVLQATVIANECVWAEVFTKAYLVLDEAARIEFAAEHGLEAMVVLLDGTRVSSRGWKGYQR